MKTLIVGAGISGATIAHEMRTHGHAVTVVDGREHIAGNCYDSIDERTKMRVHNYGPHGFHTSDSSVWGFVNRFSVFNSTELEVTARLQGGSIIPIPYNDRTREVVGDWTREDFVREMLVPYSEKMWGVSYDKIPSTITARAPIPREGNDSRWHQDTYQGVPMNGYTGMVANMLEGCELRLGAKMDYWRTIESGFDIVVFTGKLDELFNFKYGHLPYRSLNIVQKNTSKRLPTHQRNECNTLTDHTRTVDHSHWYESNARFGETVITQETPCQHVDGENTPYYPMSAFAEARSILPLYEAAARGLPDRYVLAGRLATYRYLDMHVAIKLALLKVKAILK